jgi:hypothetical protein
VADQYDDGTPRLVHWDRVLRAVPDPPRPLTTTEHRRLVALGLPEVSRRLIHGTCPDCGLNRGGQGHRDLCAKAESAKRPLKAQPEPLQPWMPRPSRRAA